MNWGLLTVPCSLNVLLEVSSDVALVRFVELWSGECRPRKVPYWEHRRRKRTFNTNWCIPDLHLHIKDS